jgi:hypothetical protein
MTKSEFNKLIADGETVEVKRLTGRHLEMAQANVV